MAADNGLLYRPYTGTSIHGHLNTAPMRQFSHAMFPSICAERSTLSKKEQRRRRVLSPLTGAKNTQIGVES